MLPGRIYTVKPTWKRSSDGLEEEIFMGHRDVQIVWLVEAQRLGYQNITVGSALFLTLSARLAV